MANTQNTPCIAVTSGEPSGIGPDICLDLVNYPSPYRIAIIGDISLLRQRAQQLSLPIQFRTFSPDLPKQIDTLDVVHIPLSEHCIPGQLNVKNAHYVLALLDHAYAGIVNHQFCAMVTAPLHKGIINDAGIPFSGHTEYLAEKSQTKKVVMMLAGGGLRVALATTHLPLKSVASHITPTLLTEVLQIIHQDLQKKFGITHPHIKIAGLNPHAGEQGHLGTEEIDFIEPLIHQLQAHLNVSGPYPADTLFQPFMLADADAVLCMYHDQGLPVLKYASFGQGVNITLGLPFIRTSVDHGTALNLAGTGQAQSSSLKAALDCAWQMVQASCAPKFDNTHTASHKQL